MLDSLVNDVLNGRRRAVARMLTIVENEREGVHDYLAALYPHTGQAWVVGVTGAPGTGKSSLVNMMTKVYRQQGQTVAIIAVDPTSPFSGGAILGDRIRMRDLSGDDGVFIRSMATRGSLGGVARTTRDATRVMDAAGFDMVIVETVGAGQSEVDIVRTADTTIVVEAPGLGDDVQAIKAGILEIADILVVNKADRQGANSTVRALRAMLDLGHPIERNQFDTHHKLYGEQGESTALTSPKDAQERLSSEDVEHPPMWITPVMRTMSLDGTGVEDLVARIASHREFLQTTKLQDAIQDRYIELELYERLQFQMMQWLSNRLSPTIIQEMVSKIRSRQIDPQSAIKQLLDDVLDDVILD